MKTTTMKFGKYLMLSFLALGITVSSCKKEEEDDAVTLPSTFTKKALVEEFTGEWCGYCPDGAAILAAMKTNNPNKYVAVGVHIGDPFEIPQGRVLTNLFSITGYPGATIVRKEFGGQYGVSRGSWESSANTDLAIAATAGLQIESSNDGSITVNYGSQSAMSGVKLTVYIVEDNIPETSSGAQSGAPAGYIHQDVLKEVLTADIGDDVSIEAGAVQTSTFKASLSGSTKSNVKVVAFLHKHNTSSNDLQVLNAQEVHLGSNSEW